MHCHLQDDSTTLAKITAGFAENSISAIDFLSTFKDTSPEGPPGEYTLVYPCMFAFNPTILLNPIISATALNNEAAPDHRLSDFNPRVANGVYGPLGNGGSQGRRLLMSKVQAQ